MHPSCLRLLKILMLDRGLQHDRAVNVLDVGSYDYNGTCRDVVKELLPNALYVGIDLIEGPNVDLVHDIEKARPQGYFDLILCANMLEHCYNPHKAAENMIEALKPGGYIIVTVPWDIPIHNRPDRWRISIDGMRVLFGHMDEFRTDFYPGDVIDTWAFGRAPLERK